MASARGAGGVGGAGRRCCALLLLAAALLRCSATKRAEMSASPFVLTGRYGRSPGRALAPRSSEMALSTRFYMISRFGKRSEAGRGGAGEERALGSAGGAGGTGDAGGGGWWCACDCSRPPRRADAGDLYERSRRRAPQRVPDED